MNILRVIVDKLPETCEKCHVYNWYDGPMCGLLQWMRPDFDPYIWDCDCSKERCPDCPLAPEQDNVRDVSPDERHHETINEYLKKRGLGAK